MNMLFLKLNFRFQLLFIIYNIGRVSSSILMAFKYPEFVNMRLERIWLSEFKAQKTIDRWRRFNKRNTDCSDPNYVVSNGEFRCDWTTDGLPFATTADQCINLDDVIKVNFHPDIGYNLVAKRKIPHNTLIGYLNGTVMEYTLNMYNSLQYICDYDKKCLKISKSRTIPLYNIHDTKRKYAGSSKDLAVGLISAKYGSSLKFINSTCDQNHKNVERWVIPFGNSLNICYYSIKSIDPGQPLLDDYMKNSKNCLCCALGVKSCINQK